MFYNLDLFDIKLKTRKGEKLGRNKSRIATHNASKCEKGGLAAVNEKPYSVTV